MEPKIREKAWNPGIEQAMLAKWEEEKLYGFDPDSGGKPFVIDTPPPYPSGQPWHIGAAAHYAQIDMIARTARMLGRNVLFPMGIDRNGLPVELYTERKYKISMRSTPRTEFLKLCREALDDLELEMVKIMQRMGLSCDLDSYYRTDSDEYRALTQATFIELWKKGLVYESSRPNNYCPDCGTTIADAEVAYQEIPSKLVHLSFALKKDGGEKKDLVIATTRPELLCSCQTVIVNPGDDRYRRIHGMHAVVPIFGREVEIRPHPAAKPEFGTGAMMVCSYGDQMDVQIFRELGLKEVVALNENGLMTENAKPYNGLSVRKARARVVQDLTERGLVAKEEKIMHRTPICERSKTPIEIIPMREYYLKQMDFLPALREIAGKMRFHPEMHRQILLNWLGSITIDWPVSRRRFYATEIPIWYCKSCKKPNLPEPGRYYRPWKEEPPFGKCAHCNNDGSGGFVGEERTFDTWMDSSISPLFVTRYMKNNSYFGKTYPAALRPQAKDIVRTWLHYTVLRCYQLTGEAPFGEAWIMGYGLDEKGERMSKSKGNVIDPFPVINQYGADTFRFWSASEVNLGYDFRCSEQKIAGTQKFLTKLWNIARFISNFPMRDLTNLGSTDRWILGELSILVENCRKGYEDFNFFVPATAIREFTWNVFAAHYIEMVKPRAYGLGFEKSEQEAACYTLHKNLSTILLLASPIVPLITDHLWRSLSYSEKSIHLQRFPEAPWSTEMTGYTKPIIEFNSLVWNKKKERRTSLKDPISLSVPAELEPFRKDLVAMHNLT
ncbi:MAG: valine--tRNA ligase [Nitrososphaerales archaeon]